MNGGLSRRKALAACCSSLTGAFDQQPRWLRWSMLDMARRVERYRLADELVLTIRPTEMVKRLDTIVRAARLLDRELQDKVILAWLGNYGASASTLTSTAVFSLVATRAADAILRVPSGQGKRHALPFPDTISGRHLCAWVVREAFRQLHNKSPGSRNGPVIEAARHLWAASGGPDVSDDTWISDFVLVDKLENGGGRPAAFFASWEHLFAAEPPRLG